MSSGTAQGRSYYQSNHHGDVSRVASGGVVVANASYDAFGNRTDGGSITDLGPFGYCGEYTDSESGLVYLRARYYEPGIGRFVSEDPIRDGLNWYVYCDGNPVNYIDPLGWASQLRDLVDETTGTISWSEKTNTATVKIDGKTQKYVVENGLVYVNEEQVGYIENGRIMVEEYDFNKDFEIVGTLTISSYWQEGDIIKSSIYEGDGFSGHAFIYYKSDDGMFDNYYSTWQWTTDENGNMIEAPGIYYNRQADIDLSTNPNTPSYNKRITKNQQTKMAKEILKAENNTWGYTNNCAGFANKVFKAATGISFNGYPLTPKKLKDKIQSK